MFWLVSLGMLLVLALLFPGTVPVIPDPRVTLACCLDTSASLAEGERSYLLQCAREYIARLPQHKIKPTFIRFGQNVERLAQMPQRLAGENGTELPLAMELALGWIRKQDNAGMILLFTDGSGQHDWQNLQQKCRAANVPVFVWHPQERRDVRIRALEVAEETAPGVMLPLTLRYASNFAGSAKLSILTQKELYLEQPVEFAATDNGLMSVRGSPLPPGLTYFVATMQADARSENNRCFGFTRVVVPETLLLITTETDTPLAQALEVQNLPVTAVTWNQIPALDSYPVVILDKPTDQLLQRHQEKWQQYLRQGGSLLVVGGEKLEQPWLPCRSRPPEASQPPKVEETVSKNPPVKNEKKAMEVELRQVAMLFVLDRSGSMEGEKISLAQQAAIAAISKLWPQDVVGVLAFNQETRWVSPLGRRTNLEGIRQRILQLTAEGGTRIAPALEKAYQSLQHVSAHLKHVILLSDGQDENWLARGELEPLVSGMRKANISLSTLGIGQDFDAVLMPLLARWGGGEFYYAEKYQEIPLLVLRDVDRILYIRKKEETSSKMQTEVPPLALPEMDLPVMPDTKNAETESVSQFPVKCPANSTLLAVFSDFPSLAAYNQYELRPGAKMELQVADDPLLSHWQWELGQVMQWNADSRDWLPWPSYQHFWARLIRFLATDSMVSWRISLKPGQQQKDWMPIHLKITGEENGQFSISSTDTFYQQEERSWVARLSLPRPGEWRTVTAKITADKKTRELTTAFALPYEDEVAHLHVAERELSEFAQHTGGGVLPQSLPRLIASLQEKPQLPWYKVWWSLFWEMPCLWLALLLCVVVLWREWRN